MQFRDFIYYVLPLLENNGFRITETLQNYVRLDSEAVVIALSYNPREYQYYIQAGPKKDELYELDAKALKAVFGFDTGELHPADYFIKFFQQHDNPLLHNNTDALHRLKNYCLQRSQEYWEKLIEGQQLQAADSAWKQKDYRTFINAIGKLDFTRLAPSYQKKYSIALAKVEKQ